LRAGSKPENNKYYLKTSVIRCTKERSHETVKTYCSSCVDAIPCSLRLSASHLTSHSNPKSRRSNTIIAEGQVEPIQYAKIAFNASGVIGEVLVKEDQSVKKGQPLIRLGNESDTNYAAAQIELVTLPTR
jgi:hypothetical protein